MKQRKPLQRRIGLRTSTPLRAKKPIKRDPAAPGNSLINPIGSKRPEVTPEEKHGRDVVRARSLMGETRMCEIALSSICSGQASEWHHRKARSQGGGWEPANGLACCHLCHSTVTDTRPEYYDNGWCVKSWDDPLTRPVLRRGQWVLLDNHGQTRPAPKKQGEAA